jgi:PHD/YefM family antitoxin component YafN of YafNO toxin-antitoxin module
MCLCLFGNKKSFDGHSLQKEAGAPLAIFRKRVYAIHIINAKEWEAVMDNIARHWRLLRMTPKSF